MRPLMVVFNVHLIFIVCAQDNFWGQDRHDLFLFIRANKELQYYKEKITIFGDRKKF